MAPPVSASSQGSILDRILVGTASWTDKTLIACGRFYPREAKTAEDRLRYYATQFPVVEIDSSYYGIPAPNMGELWAARTPSGFVFNMKVFRLFTGHATSPQVLPKDIRQALPPTDKKMLYYADVPEPLRAELWRRMRLALEPLVAAGKLGMVHFQFAPWFMIGRDAIAHLRRCAEQMAGLTVGFEFRHRSWFTERHAATTLSVERELGAVHTVVDEPQGFANSIPTVWAVTQPALAFFRLHGRNAEMWNKKGLASSSERFNYDYSEAELRALAPQVLALAGEAERTHVLFNTNFEDQGQRAARLMVEVLRSVEG